MGKFKGGAAEAAKILQQMGSGHANSLLDIIAKTNPEMANILKEGMVSFEQLQYLTPKMLANLFKTIEVSKMGLALRAGSAELREYILNNVSQTMRIEMDYILSGPPQRASDVQIAVDEIMAVVREKLDKGEILINENGDELV